MAGSDHAILDLGDDNLQFTTNDYNKSGAAQQQTGSLTQFPTPTTERDTAQLVDDEEEGEGGPSDWKTSNFWTFAFYQQFFDVDTADVKNRVLYSMVPMPGKSFLQYQVRPRPDLYGPFWVCVTLVFSIAISGNVAEYFQKSFDSPDGTNFKWHYDFHKVSMAAMVVFSYASLLPAGLFGYLWWAGAGTVGSTITFVELVCLYGYSLTIYIPVSLLWLVPISWWQWLCVMLGAGLSGFVLFTPIWPAVRNQASKSAVVIMAIIMTLHLLLAVGFMLYFFHVPPGAGGHPHNSTVEVVPSAGAENHTKALNEAQVAEIKASVQSVPVGHVLHTEDTEENNSKKQKSDSEPKENNKADVPSGTESKTDAKGDEKKNEEISNKETRSEAQPADNSTETR